MTFFDKSRERSDPKPQPILVPRKIVSGVDAGIEEVRDCILSAEQAMREQGRRKNKNLVRHQQNMLSILRGSERDLLAIRSKWERHAPD